MKISELVNAPQWLLDADTENVDVDIINGVIFWRSGVWKGGVWYSGIWKGGVWKGGAWYDGTWYDGTWENGTWHSGLWKSGIWQDGVWVHGFWVDGIWQDGIWRGGLNRSSCKLQGRIAINSSHCILEQINGLVQIGCKTKTIKEWVDWFENSTEEFETKRGTAAFKRIRAHFYAMKTYIEMLAE